MSRNIRNEELIANFVDGYAEGWYFAVGECYKNELDIKFSKRQKNKKTHKEWTQGLYFSFSVGNIFYDCIQAYTLKWGDAVNHIKSACQITTASPSRPDRTTKHHEGFVEFNLFHMNQKTGHLELNKKMKSTQTDFVEYLKTGQVPSPSDIQDNT